VFIAGALQPDGHRSSAPVNVGQPHPENAMTTVLIGPITDSLPGAQQQRQDRPVTRRLRRRRKPFRNCRV